MLVRIVRETPWRDRGGGADHPPLCHQIGAGSRSHGVLPGTGGRDGLRSRAHPEHLPSFAIRKGPRAFHHYRARKARPRSPPSTPRSRHGVTPLQTCPPLAGQTSLPQPTQSRIVFAYPPTLPGLTPAPGADTLDCASCLGLRSKGPSLRRNCHGKGSAAL